MSSDGRGLGGPDLRQAKSERYLRTLLVLLPIVTTLLGFYVVDKVYNDPLGAMLTYLVAGWWVVLLVTAAICKCIWNIYKAGSLNGWMSKHDVETRRLP